MPASQAKQAFWMVVGYVLLIGPCLRRSWQPCMSTINPFGRVPRQIDEWKWAWLNTKYGNYEDSVSGKAALIWPNPPQPRGGPLYDGRVLYMPDKDKPWWLPQWLWEALRAWLWSAWRNSTNALSRGSDPNAPP